MVAAGGLALTLVGLRRSEVSMGAPAPEAVVENDAYAGNITAARIPEAFPKDFMVGYATSDGSEDVLLVSDPKEPKTEVSVKLTTDSLIYNDGKEVALTGIRKGDRVLLRGDRNGEVFLASTLVAVVNLEDL